MLKNCLCDGAMTNLLDSISYENKPSVLKAFRQIPYVSYNALSPTWDQS